MTFRITREELLLLDHRHLAFGLFWTWIAGMGRYWDDPKAHLLQHLGVGSVIYIFVLSLMLWLVIWPLRPKDWSYRNVLTFVSLTSPPAILYAIPVERFYNLETADTLNAWSLAIVAAWRVSLLIFYLGRLGRLSPFPRIVATLLPLASIVFTLTVLNLERAVFEIMGGFRERTPNDDAYVVLILLSLLSYILAIPILICYVALIIRAYFAAKKDARSEIGNLGVEG